MLLIFSVCGTVRAERTRVFRSFLTPEGIPLEAVRDVLEDQTGAIWAATWGGGLHWFKGSQWKVFNKRNGLQDNWVRTIESDGEGGIWIGSTGGISRIQNDEITIFNPGNTPELPGSDIWKIQRVGKGKIWASFTQGFVVECNFNGEDYSWRRIDEPDLSEGARITDICHASDGAIWLSANNDNRILRFDGRNWDHPGEETLSNIASHLIYATEETGLLSCSSGTLRRFDGNGWTQLVELDETIKAVASHNGELWVGTSTGIYRQKKDYWQKIEMGLKMGVPEVLTLEFLKNGWLWIGTRQGLILGSYNSWSHFRNTSDGEPLTHLISSSVFSTQPQAIDNSNRIAVFEDQKWNPKLQLATAGSPSSNYWTFSGDNTLWSISGTHVIQHSLTNGSVIQKLQFPDLAKPERVFGLHRTINGNIWLLTDEGIFQSNNEGWLPIPDDPSYERRRVNTILEVDSDMYYIGRTHGIDHWIGDEIIDLATVDPVFSDVDVDCRSIIKMRDDSVWFGTFGLGIIVQEASSLRKLEKQQGLMSDLISNIYEAANGTVWISYRGHGMASYRNGRLINYLYETGLPDHPVTKIVESETGTIWVSTENFGVFRYEPDHEPPDTFITTGSNRIDFGGGAVFSFNGRDSWNATPPRNLLYSWRIIPDSGILESDSWSRFNKLTAVATPPLESGEYFFEVRTSDTDRNIDPTPASVRFYVATPLWSRPGFVWPVVILGCLALTALLRGYLEHKKLQRSETQVRSMNLHLERRVSDRTAELTVAYNEMEAFNASVSHDLRSPLQSVYGFGCLLSKRLKKFQDERSHEYIKKITDEAHRMGTMIDQLLQFSKLGKKVLEKTKVNLEELVREVKDNLNLENTERIINWNILELPVVEADPVLIRQVLSNLLENAVKYTSTRKQAIIEIGCLPQNLDTNEWVIFVRDNGVGFKMVDSDKLFDAFQRLHPQQQFKGTGIGLSNVKRIVNRHGGRVWAQAEEGQGATFFFSILGKRPGYAPT